MKRKQQKKNNVQLLVSLQIVIFQEKMIVHFDKIQLHVAT